MLCSSTAQLLLATRHGNLLVGEHFVDPAPGEFNDHDLDAFADSDAESGGDGVDDGGAGDVLDTELERAPFNRCGTARRTSLVTLQSWSTGRCPHDCLNS